MRRWDNQVVCLDRLWGKGFLLLCLQRTESLGQVNWASWLHVSVPLPARNVPFGHAERSETKLREGQFCSVGKNWWDFTTANVTTATPTIPPCQSKLDIHLETNKPANKAEPFEGVSEPNGEMLMFAKGQDKVQKIFNWFLGEWLFLPKQLKPKDPTPCTARSLRAIAVPPATRRLGASGRASPPPPSPHSPTAPRWRAVSAGVTWFLSVCLSKMGQWWWFMSTCHL